jgi:uncharacterized protein YggT (Ycf19 family)
MESFYKHLWNTGKVILSFSPILSAAVQELIVCCDPQETVFLALINNSISKSKITSILLHFTEPLTKTLHQKIFKRIPQMSTGVASIYTMLLICVKLKTTSLLYINIFESTSLVKCD